MTRGSKSVGVVRLRLVAASQEKTVWADWLGPVVRVLPVREGKLGERRCVYTIFSREFDKAVRCKQCFELIL